MEPRYNTPTPSAEASMACPLHTAKCDHCAATLQSPPQPPPPAYDPRTHHCTCACTCHCHKQDDLSPAQLESCTEGTIDADTKLAEDKAKAKEGGTAFLALLLLIAVICLSVFVSNQGAKLNKIASEVAQPIESQDFNAAWTSRVAAVLDSEFWSEPTDLPS